MRQHFHQQRTDNIQNRMVFTDALKPDWDVTFRNVFSFLKVKSGEISVFCVCTDRRHRTGSDSWEEGAAEK